MKKELVVIKNTIYMFFRMFFVMFLTLFSTRILLQQLGLENYGIYDLIFGVVIMFNILSGSMVTTLQRFYNVASHNYIKQSNIYSISLQVFIVIGVIVAILGCMLANIIVDFLNIPLNSYSFAIDFFLLCVLNLIIMILRLPFIAILISFEKMGLYSLFSVLDAVLKFLGVIILGYFSNSDNDLFIYGIILCVVSLIVTILYILICYIKLNMPKFRYKVDKKYYKDILVFSGWTSFGSAAVLYSQQGLSIMLNKFFGILVNAANAISQQFYTAVYQFVSSFQTAFSPYLMKTYADNNLAKVNQLIILFSKISIFLYLLVVLPLFLFLNQILIFWLGEVPDYAQIFTIWMLILVGFEVLSAPLWILIQASGNIKKYQIVVSCIIISNLPLAYLFLVWLKQPEFLFISKIMIAGFCFLYRLYKIKEITQLNYKDYFNLFILRILLLLLLMIPIVYFMKNINFNLIQTFIGVFLIVLFFIISSYFVFLNKNERARIFEYFLGLKRKEFI